MMGKAASARAATDDEIARMQQIVRDAMRAGAVGFASSTSPAHNGDAGLPMPSTSRSKRRRSTSVCRKLVKDAVSKIADLTDYAIRSLIEC